MKWGNSAWENETYVDPGPDRQMGTGDDITRLAHERFALLVLVVAGPFADEDDVGVGVPDAEDEVGAALVEAAAGAVAEVAGDRREGRGGRGPGGGRGRRWLGGRRR